MLSKHPLSVAPPPSARRPAPRRAPGSIPRLHGAIGNRAVGRLLRQATVLDEQGAQADTDAAKAALAAARAAQERLAKAAWDRVPSPIFKQAGVSTDDRADGRTARLIQSAMAESRLLAPYLSHMFPANNITAPGSFHLDETDGDFNQAYMDWQGIHDNLNEKQKQERYGKIGGFFDRRKHQIHLRPRAKVGDAVHEATHKISSAAFPNFWEPFIDEGVTQYFADRLLEEQSLPKYTGHDYGPQLACAYKLVAAGGEDAVARAYFLGETQALVSKLTAKLRLDTGELRRTIHENKLCERL